jgi:hypothetical protein
MKKTKKIFLNYLYFFILVFGLVFAFQNGSNIILVYAQNGYPPPGITPTPTPTQGIIPAFIYQIYIPQIQTSTSIGRSYYIETLDNMYDLGKKRGIDHSSLSTPISDVVILHFGNPQEYSSPGGTIYGVMLFDYSTYTFMANVETAVQQYVIGYLEGSSSNRSSTLTVIVSTNTSGYWINSNTGQAWGELIYGSNSSSGLRNWLSSQPDGPTHVLIYGGVDIEPGNFSLWRDPTPVLSWLIGFAHNYENENAYHRLYNFGTAGGCQVDYPTTEPQYQPNVYPGDCDLVTIDDEGINKYLWTQGDIYRFSNGPAIMNAYPVIYPIPEIYTLPSTYEPYGRNAAQWYRIALYNNLLNGETMYFSGVLTQQQACDDRKSENGGVMPSDCLTAYNSSSEAKLLFTTQLASDPYYRTIAFGMNWATDIGYFKGTPY